MPSRRTPSSTRPLPSPPLLLLLLGLLGLAASTGVLAAQDVRGQIQPNNELPDLSFLGANTRVFLRHIPLPDVPAPAPAAATPAAPAVEGGAPATEAAAAPSQAEQIAKKARVYVKQGETPVDRTTLVKSDGSFIFHSVATGSYTLEVVSRTNDFAKFRVDVPDESTRLSPRIRVFTPGTSLSSLLLLPSSSLLLHPLILHSTRRFDFFTTPQPFNLSSMLGIGTPMLLLAGVGIALVLFLPKLSAMLDPDTQREVAESQKAMERRMKAVQTGDLNSLLYKDDEYDRRTQAEAQKHQQRARVVDGPKKRK
ncbi:uncharacterized protein PFL1_01160 [Pseudozyma flocculosa PF-1]|uniref:ER membrane protein complex subunit 7 beta-sandwich domain-containing protein n=1 Tax=Pseudozyma flocculosa TaxID=84751 RepID=A0A5C3EXA5_9BASI|nr:uncharacterized protein PFL1_01160 [Pseudozyma flocculosa PF-1]EPQ30971.1 hypothetical protein PFL1_01160 [Pseudozyma flocculosa PF-1]SPO35809.1 uncharacterized protein PSFLO_01280 [Pseudozyma flocculosa]